MSIVLLKLRTLSNELLGIDLPILETIAYKGVLTAIIYNIIERILRNCYIGLNIVGQVLIWIFLPHEKEKIPLPPLGNRELLKDSVSTIARKVRKKEVTAVEVVKTFIERIHEINGILTSVVDHRFDEALAEAERIDSIVNTLDEDELKQKYPLIGVPFTIKDFFSVKGLRHTTGLHLRKDVIAEHDAEIVEILRSKGAIPLGITNVPELCLWWESVNTIYGRSKNPYDTRHITGGSSGGEAALQASAGSGFGIGSDIGGSIRMPAFFCGVYGHKPTVGLVTNHGQEPKLEGVLETFLTTGPIVRHADDLELLFNIMIYDEKKKLLHKPNMKNFRIFYMEDDGGSALSSTVNKQIKMGIKKAIQHLEKKFGVKAQAVKIPELYYSLEIWANGMASYDVVTFCEELARREKAVNPFLELIKFGLHCSPHTLPALLLGIIEKIAAFGKLLPWHKEMIHKGRVLADELQKLLGTDGILVYPTHPNSAPRHHEPIFRPADFSYCAIFNVIGVPVTQVPLGLNEHGLPIGVQIIGGMHSDLLTIRAAKAIHEETGGWVPPCEVP